MSRPHRFAAAQKERVCRLATGVKAAALRFGGYALFLASGGSGRDGWQQLSEKSKASSSELCCMSFVSCCHRHRVSIIRAFIAVFPERRRSSEQTPVGSAGVSSPQAKTDGALAESAEVLHKEVLHDCFLHVDKHVRMRACRKKRNT